MERLRWMTLLILLLPGCSDQGDETTPAGPNVEPITFAGTIQPIFNQSCAVAGCHDTGSSSAGLVLAAGSSYANLVGVPSQRHAPLLRVKAGEPDSSAIYLLLQGTRSPRMPLGGQLPTDKIEDVATWIADGALDN